MEKYRQLSAGSSASLLLPRPRRSWRRVFLIWKKLGCNYVSSIYVEYRGDSQILGALPTRSRRLPKRAIAKPPLLFD
jgi:hypothetical protein